MTPTQTSLTEETAVAWTWEGHRHPAVRARAKLLTGGCHTGQLRTRVQGPDHEPGTCRPSCSAECYQAKLRSVAFTLPAGFRAAR